MNASVSLLAETRDSRVPSLEEISIERPGNQPLTLLPETRIDSGVRSYSSTATYYGRIIKAYRLNKEIQAGEDVLINVGAQYPHIESEFREIVSLKFHEISELSNLQAKIRTELERLAETGEETLAGARLHAGLYHMGNLRSDCSPYGSHERTKNSKARLETLAKLGFSSEIEEIRNVTKQLSASIVELTHREECLNGKQVDDFARTVAEGMLSSQELKSLDWICSPELPPITAQTYSAAINQMVEINFPLVLSIAKRFGFGSRTPFRSTRVSNIEFDDVIQLGRVALWRAASLYDPDRGLQFSTVATAYIKKDISKFVTKEFARQEFALDAPIGNSEISRASSISDPTAHSPLDRAMLSELSSLITSVMAKVEKLSPEHMTTIVERLGLDGKAPRTLEAIGEKDSICKQAVSLRLDAAIRELQKLLSPDELSDIQTQLSVNDQFLQPSQTGRYFTHHEARPREAHHYMAPLRKIVAPSRRMKSTHMVWEAQPVRLFLVPSGNDAVDQKTLDLAGKLVETLSTKERNAAALLTGLTDKGVQSPEQVAEQLGVSRATVYRIRNVAINTLRQYLSDQQIESLFKANRSDSKKLLNNLSTEALEVLRKKVDLACEKLDLSGGYILKARLGLGGECLSFDKIGQHFGLANGTEVIRQQLKKVIGIISADDRQLARQIEALAFPRTMKRKLAADPDTLAITAS